MNYPVTIIDDFFPDPDKIVELAYEAEYTNTTDGRCQVKELRILIHSIVLYLIGYAEDYFNGITKEFLTTGRWI